MATPAPKHRARRALAALASFALTAGCRDGGAALTTSSAVSVSAAPIDPKLELPHFVLVDQHGQRFDSADMRGKVWVVDFIFTTCPKVCPDLTKRMSRLVDATKADTAVRFLSISVDPENDTPEKLEAFVEKFGQVSPRWSLVTGDPKTVEDTVLAGFKVATGKDGAGNLFHGEYFVVVDPDGRARGFFTAKDADEAIVARARELSR